MMRYMQQAPTFCATPPCVQILIFVVALPRCPLRVLPALDRLYMIPPKRHGGTRSSTIWLVILYGQACSAVHIRVKYQVYD